MVGWFFVILVAYKTYVGRGNFLLFFYRNAILIDFDFVLTNKQNISSSASARFSIFTVQTKFSTLLIGYHLPTQI